MPHRQMHMEECEKILDQKLAEYIKTHQHWDKKGYLCPHEGDPRAHETMDEIIEDVQQAHDMLEIAMKRSGKTWEDMHHKSYGMGTLETPGAAPPGQKLPG